MSAFYHFLSFTASFYSLSPFDLFLTARRIPRIFFAKKITIIVVNVFTRCASISKGQRRHADNKPHAQFSTAPTADEAGDLTTRRNLLRQLPTPKLLQER